MQGHSRFLAQLRAQQLLVNGAAKLLWVSNPRWVQLLLLKYCFSSSFKSNGELRDWEGGKFPNKQTLREGLSQARQWKEPDSKVPCKRRLLHSPSHRHKDVAPEQLGVEDTEGGFAASPTSFPATLV